MMAKKERYPKNYNVNITCTFCMFTFSTMSTLNNQDIRIDICSHCHPFYIGKQQGHIQKGKVERFNTRIEKADQLQLMKTQITMQQKLQKDAPTDFVEPASTTSQLDETSITEKTILTKPVVKKVVIKKPITEKPSITKKIVIKKTKKTLDDSVNII